MAFQFNEDSEKQFQWLLKRYPEKRAALLPAFRLAEEQQGYVDNPAIVSGTPVITNAWGIYVKANTLASNPVAIETVGTAPSSFSPRPNRCRPLWGNSISRRRTFGVWTPEC